MKPKNPPSPHERKVALFPFWLSTAALLWFIYQQDLSSWYIQVADLTIPGWLIKIVAFVVITTIASAFTLFFGVLK